MPHHYSPFWLAFCAGQLTLSPLWTERDDSTPELGPYDDYYQLYRPYAAALDCSVAGDTGYL